MRSYTEHHASPHFLPLDLHGIYNQDIKALSTALCSVRAHRLLRVFSATTGIFQGIPFSLEANKGRLQKLLLLNDQKASISAPDSIQAAHIVFLHSADMNPELPAADGLFSGMKGNPRLGEQVAEYSLHYSDGSSHSVPVRRRFNIGELEYDHFGEYCFEAIPHCKPHRIRTASEDILRNQRPATTWGDTQYRALSERMIGAPYFWLYALPNPHPEKTLKQIVMTPKEGTVFILGISLCRLDSNPLRWDSRKKILVHLPAGEKLDRDGDYRHIDIDLGGIIAVSRVLDYGNEGWENGYNNRQAEARDDSMLVEYTAHPAAEVYFGSGGKLHLSLEDLAASSTVGFRISAVAPANQRVHLKVVEKDSSRPVAVKLHIHGEAGEYLPPITRHRYPNPFWFEDYSVDFVHGTHNCSYIDGEADLLLPLGNVYIEVSKGFEMRPVRRRFTIDGRTPAIQLELDHVLPWRAKGWVTADTHVHFLSPQTALLEGQAEGVNIVNLLATQWGEFLSNIGDFDGRTTIGSREQGGSGEYLVRVGTENRQHVLGHISLLGYEGRMILPLVAGGPDEGPLGDPVDVLVSTWAEQCRRQGGLAILPHFPLPRAEGAAAILLETIDGVEMTSWSSLYLGISPYSLSDWYRYLNCGCRVAAVGGTDKMSSTTAVGTVRTYARVDGESFTYDDWKQAIRRGETFVTYGPLLEFTVDGKPMGSTISLPAKGGSLEVDWEVATVTVPITQVELVFNAETREACCINPVEMGRKGTFSLPVSDSGWIALRVRGRYPDQKEIITAHSSPVYVRVEGKPCLNHQDALTILEQIEGAKAYLSTIGTRAESATFKKLLMVLSSAHRMLHNQLHQLGQYHRHTPVDDHHLGR